MAVTVSQEAVFEGATLGVAMSDFQFTILAILFSGLYLWLAWLIFSQWRAWGEGHIDFYKLVMRSTRATLVVLVLGFLLK